MNSIICGIWDVTSKLLFPELYRLHCLSPAGPTVSQTHSAGTSKAFVCFHASLPVHCVTVNTSKKTFLCHFSIPSV